jgi:hypothetical protein
VIETSHVTKIRSVSASLWIAPSIHQAGCRARPFVRAQVTGLFHKNRSQSCWKGCGGTSQFAPMGAEGCQGRSLAKGA